MRVSSDGVQVLEDVLLSASCIIVPVQAKSEAAVISRLYGHAPNEGDYFTAMEYDMSLHIVFRSGAFWKTGSPER